MPTDPVNGVPAERGNLADEFAAAWRLYKVDVFASTVLFVAVALAAGRVWRYPFDDELIALRSVTDHLDLVQTLSFYMSGGDIHPPLSFLAFHALHDAGLGEPGLRLFSLGATTISLALMQLITLSMLLKKLPGSVEPIARAMAIVLFGTTPLAVSLGDAIRWYPLFALLFFSFVAAYLAAPGVRTRLLSAVPLGLSVSTNFLAAFVILPFAIYRYAFERRFRARFDAAYWAIVLICALPGLWSAFEIAQRYESLAHSEFGRGALRAVPMTVLGFFGGNAIGIGLSWLVLPVAAVTAIAIYSLAKHARKSDPVNLLLLCFAGMAIMALCGFEKSRSFLYLAPAAVAVQVLYLFRQFAISTKRAVILLALVLAPAVCATASINGSSRPFKRNMAIPYDAVAGYITLNAGAGALIVSTDPVLFHVLGGHEGWCLNYVLGDAPCAKDTKHFSEVVIVSGHSDLSESQEGSAALGAALLRDAAGRRRIAEAHFGRDDDTALKNRLAHGHLDAFLLDVSIYR